MIAIFDNFKVILQLCYQIITFLCLGVGLIEFFFDDVL